MAIFGAKSWIFCFNEPQRPFINFIGISKPTLTPLHYLSIMASSYFPKEVVDPHHHFIDTANTSFQTFLRSAAGCDVLCLPEDYTRDVIEPLSKIGVKFYGSVHVEAMPDNGSDEVAWVEKMAGEGRCTYVKAYVASCDLTQENVEDELAQLAKTSPTKLRGIRWILDCVGKFEGGKTATHVATSRHDGVDYLKSPNFERGLALLEKRDLSFDLQCAPIQLVESASALFAKYPNLKGVWNAAISNALFVCSIIHFIEINLILGV